MTALKSLTTGDIAKYCDVNLRTVIRWIDNGSLKGYKLPGRGNNRVKVEDFLLFLNENNMPVPDELAAKSQNKNILIVDDEAAIARAIQRVTMRAGYTTLIANDGFQAGLLLASYKPALMTLDLSMPGLNGFEVIKYTRANKEFDNIKILVISALDQKQLEKACEYGADMALSKPFENKSLLENIHRLIEK